MKDVPGFLQQSQSSGPGEAAVWHRLEELYTKKLWHQLTLQVLDFVQDPCFAQGDGLIKLYENFISDFEHRVNPLSLVEIILHVVRQMTDPNVALTFLEKTREKGMKDRLESWCTDVKSMEMLVEHQAHDVLT
uniref:Proteasome 26S subunit, non-ATPase 13 n=1 Tax=Myotis myotis TaxID=51298 RepID=A0A7J7RHD2_MYOMY|nr:proteasome 26S subunit, non-ATPase 13 [Myotis myotis]